MNKQKYKKYHPYGGSAEKPRRKAITLKRLMNPEVKQKDSFEPWAGGSVGSTNFEALAVSMPARGTSSSTRLGNRIQAIGLRVRGSVAQSNLQVTATGALRLRVCLVKITNLNNQVYPDMQDLFEISTTVDGTMANIKLGKNKTHKILKDQVFELDKVLGTIFNFDWYFKLDDMINLSLNNGNYQDSNNIGYVLYFIPGQPSITSQDDFMFTGSTQLTYIDV